MFSKEKYAIIWGKKSGCKVVDAQLPSLGKAVLLVGKMKARRPHLDVFVSRNPNTGLATCERKTTMHGGRWGLQMVRRRFLMAFRTSSYMPLSPTSSSYTPFCERKSTPISPRKRQHLKLLSQAAENVANMFRSKKQACNFSQ